MLGSAFSGARRDGSAIPPTLVEEPQSYAEVHFDEEGSATSPSPRKSIYTSSPDPQHGKDDDGDSGSDSDDEGSAISPPRRAFGSSLYHRIFPLSPLSKNVLKCVLAYLVAELFTFVPFLTDFLGSPWDVDGPVKNAHV